MFPPPPSASFSVVYCCGNDLCTFSFPLFKQIKPGSSPPNVPSPTTLFLSSSQYLIHIWQPLHPHISAAQPLLWMMSLLLLPPTPVSIVFSPLILLVFSVLLLTAFAMSFWSRIEFLLYPLQTLDPAGFCDYIISPSISINPLLYLQYLLVAQINCTENLSCISCPDYLLSLIHDFGLGFLFPFPEIF